MASVRIQERGIFIDGKNTKILSGAMHYFRIFPEYWEDRLVKLKEMGCNCVETYLAWNLHEKEENVFDFEGILDFCAFLTLARKLGLYAIVRPGPYICSECDFGGLPWWLLKYEGMEIRCSHAVYLEKVMRYFDVVLPMLKKHLITNGGNVIMVQIENEYGSYGSDKNYLKALLQAYEKHGLDVPYFTADGADKDCLRRGTLEGVYKTINFWANSDRPYELLQSFQPNLPLGVMELWNGDCMHWGRKVVKKDDEEVKEVLERALSHCALVNLYMFHGGTNFGFFPGGVCYPFTTNITSYDLQAPLNEYGKKTEKYYIEQEIICRYMGQPIVNRSAEPCLTGYGEASYVGKMPVRHLGQEYYHTVQSKTLLSMEECNQGHGYIVYETEFELGEKGCILRYPQIHDFAHIYIDGQFINDAQRAVEDKFDVNVEDGFAVGKHKLTFFIEELGRVHVYAQANDKKGLLGELKIFDKATQKWSVAENWTIRCYPFERAEVTPCALDEVKKPYLFQYEIELTPQSDTYVELQGFFRGLVYVNGTLLGRYACNGPQKSYYLPKSLLKEGKNELIILDVFNYATERHVLLHGKQIITGYTE